MTIRVRVTKDEEERFCLGNYSPFSDWAVDATFGFNDMSCMQLLIDHGLTDYRDPLDRAAYDDYDDFIPCYYHAGWPARPLPCADLRGGHNSVLNWLLGYPPRHVVQAMLILGRRRGPKPHPRLLPLFHLNYSF